MEVEQLALEIAVKGTYDDHLTVLETFIHNRMAKLGMTTAPPVPAQREKKSVYDFNVDDIVKFNSQANPKYLCGHKAKIVKLNRTRVSIELIEPAKVHPYKWRGVIKCPTSIIEKE